MRLLETERLGGFNETQIDPPVEFDVTLPDGRKLGYTALLESIPAITSSRDDHEDPQLVLTVLSEVPEWDDTEHYPVQRLSRAHGRNIEVISDATTIVDQYGNEFHNIGIKGSDFTNPRLLPWEQADRGYIVHGLQESIVLERVLRASRLLRERGVDTEYTIGLALPEKYLVPRGEGIDDVIALDNKPFVEQAVTRYFKTLSEEQLEGVDLLTKKAELIDKVHDIEYVVSLRAMKTPYRLQEIRAPRTNFRDMITQLAKRADNPNIESCADNYWRYVIFELPKRIAENVAKMHNIGLVHGFLHEGNITALGGIVDLDSVRGPALELGDAEVTVREQAQDVETVLYELSHIIAPKYFMDDPDSRPSTLKYLQYGFVEFLKEYCNIRGFTDEQKVEFCAEVSALNSRREHDDCIGHRVFQSYVLDAFLPSILTDPSFEEIGDESLADINKTDSDYFSLLPAKLFAKMNDVTKSHFYPVALKEGAMQPLLTGAVKDIYSNKLGQAYLKGKLSAKQYLWQVACIDAFDTEDLPDTLRNKIIPFNAAIMSQIYDKLATPKIEDVQSSALANILRSSRPDLLDHHAVIRVDNYAVDVIYVKGTGERDRFVQEFLHDCKSLKYRNYEDMDEDNNIEMVSDEDRVVLIASLSLADDFAHANSNTTVERIIEYHKWPFAVVRGVDSGHITLYFRRGEGDAPKLFEDK